MVTVTSTRTNAGCAVAANSLLHRGSVGNFYLCGAAFIEDRVYRIVRASTTNACTKFALGLCDDGVFAADLDLSISTLKALVNATVTFTATAANTGATKALRLDHASGDQHISPAAINVAPASAYTSAILTLRLDMTAGDGHCTAAAIYSLACANAGSLNIAAVDGDRLAAVIRVVLIDLAASAGIACADAGSTLAARCRDLSAIDHDTAGIFSMVIAICSSSYTSAAVTTARSSQAANVLDSIAAFFGSNCIFLGLFLLIRLHCAIVPEVIPDGQSAFRVIVTLFQAGMTLAAGQDIAAVQLNVDIAFTRNFHGGFAVGFDLCIVQRDIEGIFRSGDLIDDLDDIADGGGHWVGKGRWGRGLIGHDARICILRVLVLVLLAALVGFRAALVLLVVLVLLVGFRVALVALVALVLLVGFRVVLVGLVALILLVGFRVVLVILAVRAGDLLIRLSVQLPGIADHGAVLVLRYRGLRGLGIVLRSICSGRCGGGRLCDRVVAGNGDLVVLFTV